MVQRIIILITLLVVWNAQATLTLVVRETFQGVGTLDTNTPGNLNIVQGSFYKRAGGPRVTNDTTAASLGWSADFHTVASSSVIRCHTNNIAASTAATNGVYTCWYFVPQLFANGANQGDFNKTKQANGNQFMQLLFKPNSNGNFWTIGSYDFATTDSSVAVPLRQWFELRHFWRKVSGTTYDYTLNYRLAGSLSWSNIVVKTSANFGGAINNMSSGQQPFTEGGAYFVGRYGMPALYAATSSTDSTNLISDVSDPMMPMTWYLNPATGSDTNDGVTPSSAWQTSTKLNSESLYCGMFPAYSYPLGDTLIGDTSSGSLRTLAEIIIYTSGLNIRAATNVLWFTTQPWISIPSANWTNHLLLPAVYYSTNTVALTCLWEDDKWMNHPTGTTLASVSNSLQTTAGSYWTDGTNLYVHPFANTNPTSDGKTYTRSHAGITTSVWNLNADNLNVQDLYIRKSCDVSNVDSSPNAGYCIGTGGGWRGTNVIKHCYVDYWGKHGVSMVANSALGELTTIENVESDQGSPYGSQTPFVSFNSLGTNNIQHFYTNCVNLTFSGVIGSTNGISQGNAFISHNNGSSNQFAVLSFNNCLFVNSTINCSLSAILISADGTTFGGDDQSGAQTKTFTRCRWTTKVPNQTRTDGTMTVRNCLIAPVVGGGLSDFSGSSGGAMIIEGNTYDMSGSTVSGGYPNAGIMTWGTNSTITFRNNLVIFGAADMSMFKNFTNTDTLTVSNNVYQITAAQTTFAKNYNGSTRSFAQWQGLGFDANSLSANPCLDSRYRPYAKTPSRNVGVELGPLTDYAGKLFQSRRTAGAFEYVTDNPRALMFQR